MAIHTAPTAVHPGGVMGAPVGARQRSAEDDLESRLNDTCIMHASERMRCSPLRRSTHGPRAGVGATCRRLKAAIKRRMAPHELRASRARRPNGRLPTPHESRAPSGLTHPRRMRRNEKRHRAGDRFGSRTRGARSSSGSFFVNGAGPLLVSAEALAHSLRPHVTARSLDDARRVR